MVKSAVITSFLGKTKDRFHEYNKDRTLEEKMKMVCEMEGINGVEVVYPYEVNDPEELKMLMKKYNIEVAAVNVNIKAEPEFRNGGITSLHKEVRDKAVRFIKEAKDFAKTIGADKVTCCPLGDGYEFSFQYDYKLAWNNIVESFKTAGSYLREIPLFIEYKPSETRGRCFIDTAAKTLYLLNCIGISEMGITLDFGHSTYGNENPAEAATLIAMSGYGLYIHINDNNARWDWDYFVGTKHLLNYIEFLYYLQKYNYNGFFTSDTSPTRWDIKRTFETNARVTNKLWDKLNKIDKKTFKKLINGEDYLETWRFIEENILSI